MTGFLRQTTTLQRLFLAVLVLLFAGVSVQYSFKAAKGRGAINRWSPQLQQLETGEDIHKQHNYPNPPIMALMLWPLSELVTYSPLLGALTWYYLKVIMAIACFLWVFRLVETPEKPFPVWAKMLAVGLSIRPILGDLSHGNINIFILFLVVSSLAAFSRGRDFLAGVLLALAIASKVTPALFVGYFLWKRAWKVLLGVGAGLVLFFLLVPALFLGWDGNLQSLRSWIEVMILPFLKGGIVTPEHNNQSLPGLAARMLTAAPSFSTYIGDIYVPLRYDNIADIGPKAASLVVKGFMAVFVFLVVWKCRAPIHDTNAESKKETESSLSSIPHSAIRIPQLRSRQGWRLAAEYSLIALGMLLFSERTWKHHCVMLMLPFAVLSYGIAQTDLGRSRRIVLLTLTLLAIAVMMTSSTGIYGEKLDRLQDQASVIGGAIGSAGLFTATQSGILTDSPAKLAQVYGAYVWGFFLLITGLIVQLRHREPTHVAACVVNDPPLRRAG